MRYRNYKALAISSGVLFASLFVSSGWAGGIESRSTAAWHTAISLGGGIAINSSSIGAAQTFPISNPATDEFYQYSPNAHTQTQGLWEAFVGAERAFNHDLALQIGADYSQIGSLTVSGALVQGVDVPTENRYGYSYHISARQVLAEAKLLYKKSGLPIHPYFLAGLGVGLNSATSFSTTVPPAQAVTRYYANNMQTSFAWNVGIGLDGDVSQYVQLGLGYRFANMGRLSLGNANIDLTPVSGTLSQSHFYVNEVLAQITFVI